MKLVRQLFRRLWICKLACSEAAIANHTPKVIAEALGLMKMDQNI